MRSFIYLIGSTDDFTSIDELLVSWYQTGATGKNASIFRITLSENTQVAGYDSLEAVATMLGRGEAMTAGWCLDDTVSTLLLDMGTEHDSKS